MFPTFLFNSIVEMKLDFGRWKPATEIYVTEAAMDVAAAALVDITPIA